MNFTDLRRRAEKLTRQNKGRAEQLARQNSPRIASGADKAALQFKRRFGRDAQVDKAVAKLKGILPTTPPPPPPTSTF